MRAALAMVLTMVLAASCSPWRTGESSFVSRAAPSFDGKEWHTCYGGGMCMEGWACVKDGCEWCGDDHAVGGTRCTAGND